MWIIGDKFVCESAEVIRHIFNLMDERDESVIDQDQPLKHVSYLANAYDIEVFTSKSLDAMRSSLGHLRNILGTALKEHCLLPKYIIVVLEDDIMRCVNFPRPGISEIFGQCLKWLADEYHDMITTRKNVLPPKSHKYLYPQMFWVALPQHHNFNDNTLRYKFNQCSWPV